MLTLHSLRTCYAVRPKNCWLTKIIEQLECHGTGTPAGDPAEVEGVGSVFGIHRNPKDPLIIGSVGPPFFGMLCIFCEELRKMESSTQHTLTSRDRSKAILGTQSQQQDCLV